MTTGRSNRLVRMAGPLERRPRTQGGYMLASTLAFAGLVAILLASMLAMTGTAFKIGERFRTSAQVDAAADSALEVVTNALRRQQPVLADDASMQTCASGPLPDNGSTFDDLTSTYELWVPLPGGAGDSAVTVTCSITLPADDEDDASESSRVATLKAYVALDGTFVTVGPSSKPNGLAVVQVVHQVSGDEATRLVVREWRIGNGADTVITDTVRPQLKVEFLVVGGGGAGGGKTGGGGGGGGVVSNMGGRPLRVDDGQFNVTVGAGAPGGQPFTSPSANGNPSSFNGIVAKGGGGGGANALKGADGGSGGGGGHENDSLPAGSRSTAGKGWPGQGNDGGSGSNEAGVYGGGGGGGAGAVGGKGSPTKGGDGGSGVSNAITGTPVLYAAGGGGGAFLGLAPARGLGGAGGGGNGGAGSAANIIQPTAGQNGTGSGGGGQRSNASTTGGAGGSGVVIIRYQGTPRSTGGVITQAGGYTIHTFSTPGNYTLTIKPAVEYLVVGGGGAGGPQTGGGGGAGGVLTNMGTPMLVEPGTTYAVQVGAGGAGGQAMGASKRGANGQSSRFDTVVADGGGGGAANKIVGASGGSGGGGGHEDEALPAGSRSTAGSGTPGQGNPGGTGSNEAGVYGAGAGGGAGTSGGTGSPTKGGNGGSARSITIAGTPALYGAGGGGGAYGGTALSIGLGGDGLGGNGGAGSNAAPVAPTAGAANTGSGGGGQRTNATLTGGAGGSGIVIIRYPGSPRATGGTISQADGYTIHTFSSPGTFSITFS